MDWSKLPDIVAVALLAWAFASVVRHNYNRVSGLWLTGWMLVVLHFIAFFFLPAPRIWGLIAALVGISSLAWAGVLFMWASVPYGVNGSSYRMLFVLLIANSIYIYTLVVPGPRWHLDVASVLLGLGPLAVALRWVHKVNHVLRWVAVVLYGSLSVFLTVIQQRPDFDPNLGIDAVLFTIFFGCCVHFWYMYRHSTAGAYITICGFFAWAAVFIVSPLQPAYFPTVKIENEVWNLPKYVVAVGMILLLLEEQIEHNKHLALHDVLTGLPNRRLFQDRLSSALERARRAGTHAALLVLDLDRFKQVNDTLGHHVGDLLLQRVAKVFAARVRRSDTVARTGGDEFSIILEGPTSRTEAMHVGNSLQDLLMEPLELDGRKVKAGVSMGLAIYPDDAADTESLCIEADLRMYENKRTGARGGRSRISAI